jgi:molecular chaperone Hsp33
MHPTPDTLQKFLFEHAPIRGEFVHLDQSWLSILQRHDYPLVLQNILGELTAAAVLLAATLKLRGALVLQIQGSGALNLLVVECSDSQQIRATAKWQGELSGSLREMVGEGRFVITLDPKDGGQAYQGVVALEGESVAEILQNYMLRSEQLETRLWLAADKQCAAGMLLQKLPDQAVQDDDAWSRATQFADTLQAEELLALAPQALLHRLYHEEDLRVFEPQSVEFHCACSRGNVAQMLQMLGRDEVDSIVLERGEVEVFCEFCNQRYGFDAVDVEAMFAPALSVLGSDTKH